MRNVHVLTSARGMVFGVYETRKDALKRVEEMDESEATSRAELSMPEHVPTVWDGNTGWIGNGTNTVRYLIREYPVRSLRIINFDPIMFVKDMTIIVMATMLWGWWGLLAWLIGSVVTTTGVIAIYLVGRK